MNKRTREWNRLRILKTLFQYHLASIVAKTWCQPDFRSFISVFSSSQEFVVVVVVYTVVLKFYHGVLCAGFSVPPPPPIQLLWHLADYFKPQMLLLLELPISWSIPLYPLFLPFTFYVFVFSVCILGQITWLLFPMLVLNF